MLHKHELPRSYVVQTQDMKAYRQNRKYLRMSPDDTDLEQYQHTNSNGVPQLSSTSSPNAFSTPSKSPPPTVLIQAPGSSPKVSSHIQDEVPPPAMTRLGRIIKPPKRLNL
ncbi:hypothetical protein QYM36_019353 [Artemia franciscana]|uniref:Uncharacterized protein n=1 Tax=Artemia franciscana TaxID=6661 RepID=A0AA88KR14_ARTSF|nr:hypothetical protein QYM36_019353 [Artemia franciscana]